MLYQSGILHVKHRTPFSKHHILKLTHIYARTHTQTWDTPSTPVYPNIRTSSDVWSAPCLHHPCELPFNAGLWSLFITSKQGRDVSITGPDVQISRVVSALTVPCLPRPAVYLRRGAQAAGGEPWLIVSSCNITGPSLRGQQLCTRIHNPALR